MFRNTYRKALRANRRYGVKIKSLKRLSFIITVLLSAIVLTILFSFTNSIAKTITKPNQNHTQTEEKSKVQHNKNIMMKKSRNHIIKTSRGEERDKIPMYDISLSKELQIYTYNLCKENNLPYELILAVMFQESRFDENCISKNTNGTKDVGIMQINTCNHDWLSKKLDIYDFSDPKQSIKAGVHMLSNLSKQYENVHSVLIAYNMGNSKVDKFETTKYSRNVVKYMERLINEGKLSD